MLIERSISGSPVVPLAAQLVERGRGHRFEVLADGLRVDGVGAEMLAPDLGDLWLGDERPERRGQPRIDRDDDPRHPHLGGDVGGMERSGAAKGDQGVLPRIEPAIDGEHADGVGHVLVGDVDDRLRRLHAVETDAVAELVELRFRLRHAERDGAAEEVVRVEPPQREIGIGDGDLLATGVVADRAGIGAGALRADAEEPALVDPGDRAAARADGGEIDRRRGDGQTPLDLEIGRVRDLAVAHQPDVAGGASHVERDEIPLRPASCPKYCPAMMPPASPERRNLIGSASAASAGVLPPFDFISDQGASRPAWANAAKASSM